MRKTLLIKHEEISLHTVAQVPFYARPRHGAVLTSRTVPPCAMPGTNVAYGGTKDALYYVY
eukprot:3465378-Rhodomonas_salina.4